MGFSRQEYWNGLPIPSPSDLPDPRIKPTSLVSPELAGRFFTTRATGFRDLGFTSNDFSLQMSMMGFCHVLKFKKKTGETRWAEIS